MKTYTWLGSRGQELKLIADVTMELRKVTYDSDGYIIVTDRVEVYTKATLTAYVDGKSIGTDCTNINFWNTIKVTSMSGIKRIWGIQEILFTEERAIEIEAFLNEVIESAKNEEVKMLEEAKAVKAQTEKIENAQRVIESAKRIISEKGTLMTEKEAQQWQSNYSEVFNEGCEGYVPEIITQELYQYTLDGLNN